MKPFKVKTEYTFTVGYNHHKFDWHEARDYKVTELKMDAWNLYGKGGDGVKVILHDLTGVLEVRGNKRGKTAKAAMYVLERFRQFENWEEI